MACTCTTLPSSRNRVHVRAHPRRIAQGVTRVSEHARNRTEAKFTAPRSFTSPGGRKFTVRRAHADTDTWHVFHNGERAGSLWITRSYGPTPKWMGNVKDLVWAGPMPPTGLGFDSGPEATRAAILATWGRKADEVLDWRAGKPVRSIYADGRGHRDSGQREGVFQRNNAGRSTKYEVEKNRTPGYYTAYRYESGKLVLQSASIRANSAKEARKKIQENRVVWFEPHP